MSNLKFGSLFFIRIPPALIKSSLKNQKYAFIPGVMLRSTREVSGLLSQNSIGFSFSSPLLCIGIAAVCFLLLPTIIQRAYHLASIL